MLNQTILKFSSHQKIEKLKGGQEQAIKAGHLVLKPVDDEDEYLWIADVLNNLDTTNINIAKPVLSLHGNYIEDGFGATEFFSNIGHTYDIDLGLRLCRQLSERLKHITKPSFLFENLNNPWKKAHYLAWNEISLSNLPNELLFLINLRKPLDFPNQLIHTDLTGNILIDKNGSTCIIDFTPSFFPKEYAEAIMIVDYVSWHNAPLSMINKMNLPELISHQFILRALIFRMSVSIFMSSIDIETTFQEELKQYQKLYLSFKDSDIT